MQTSRPSLTDREHLLPAREAREAFIIAYERLRGLAATARSPAVLVAAVSAYGRAVEAVSIEPGHSLVIGRHTLCRLQLPAETISLRHLVAYAHAAGPGAAPVIRLWDLNTGRPFLTEDGQPNAAVIAQGLLYAAVGEYALFFVPTRGRAEPLWPARAEEAWKTWPPRQFIDRSTPHTAHLQGFKPPRADGQSYKTDISREGPLRMLSEHGRPSSAWGALKLVHGKEVEEHHLSLESLEQGVLLGRYGRCAIGLLHLGAISRVHLLLVRMGEGVLAIDTASTNGTWRGWRKIEAATLGGLDTLTLSNSLRLTWRRTD